MALSNVQFFSGSTAAQMWKKAEIKMNKCYNFPRVFTTYIRVCYYTCLMPFTLVQTQENSGFEIKTNLGQKVGCALLHTILIFHSLLKITSYLSGSLQENPSNVYDIYIQLFDLFQFVTFFYVGWTKRQQFLKLVNLVPPHPNDSYNERKNQWVTYAVLALTFVARNIRFPYLYLDVANRNPSLRSRIGISLHLFGQTETEDDYEGDIHPSLVALVVIADSVLYLQCITYGIPSVLCLVGAYAIYEVLGDLKQLFENELDPTYGNIVKSFTKCKSWIAEINATVQYVFLFDFLVSMLTTPKDMFVAIDGGVKILWRIIPIVSRLYWYPVYFVAVRSVQRIEYFQEMLTKKLLTEANIEEKWDVRQNKTLHFILEQATPSNLGVKAGSFFTISCGFIGTTLGFLMTYILVLIQFKVPSCPTK